MLASSREINGVVDYVFYACHEKGKMGADHIFCVALNELK